MIDRTKYLACAMNRLANDHSFIRFESILETALLKIEAAAKVFSEMLDAIMHGKSSCLVHNYGYSQETKRVVRETLESLGYETESYSGPLYEDFAFRVIWRKPKEIKPVYGIPNIRFAKDIARADEVMAQWAKLAEVRKKGDQNG